jgi:transcriptional regulator with XRE-family HTH domain
MADNTKKTAKYQNALALAAEHAARFGALVRQRREALNLRQEDIAFTTGLGRRFIIELEAGKASCQLGRALTVAAAVGLRPFDRAAETNDDNPLLPDAPEDGKDQ